MSMVNKQGIWCASLLENNSAVKLNKDNVISNKNLAFNTNESISATATSTNSTWGACVKYYYSNGSNIPLENGQQYTLSFNYEFDWSEVSDTDHSIIGCGIGTNTAGNTGYTADTFHIMAPYLTYGGSTDKGKFIFNFTVNKAGLYFAFRLLRYDGKNYNGVKIKIWDFKLEKGSEATIWLPNYIDDYNLYFNTPIEATQFYEI